MFFFQKHFFVKKPCFLEGRDSSQKRVFSQNRDLCLRIMGKPTLSIENRLLKGESGFLMKNLEFFGHKKGIFFWWQHFKRVKNESNPRLNAFNLG